MIEMKPCVIIHNHKVDQVVDILNPMNNLHPPYITIDFGLAGYYAVLREWYEDIMDYDITNTGIGHYPSYNEAFDEAKEWALSENIELKL